MAEVVSGEVPVLERPELSALLSRLTPGGSLVAARLDPLGCDIVDVLELLRKLNEQCIRVCILNVGAETGIANGRMFLTSFY